MMTTSKSKSKREMGKWAVKVQGTRIDEIVVMGNRKWTRDSGSEYRYLILGDDSESGVDDRDEIRPTLADLIREIRNAEIEARRDRDNDELDEAIESIKDADKARKALEVLRAAGLI